MPQPDRHLSRHISIRLAYQLGNIFATCNGHCLSRRISISQPLSVWPARKSPPEKDLVRLTVRLRPAAFHLQAGRPSNTDQPLNEPYFFSRSYNVGLLMPSSSAALATLPTFLSMAAVMNSLSTFSLASLSVITPLD